MLTDPYFHNLVTHCWIAADDVLGSLTRLRARNEEILERITASLRE